MNLRDKSRSIVGVTDTRSAFNLSLLSLLPIKQRVASLLQCEERNGSVRLHPFESVRAMAVERTYRVRSLLRNAELLDSTPGDGTRAREERALAEALKASSARRPLRNLADPLFARSVRNAFASHLIAAVEARAHDTRAHVCTIIVRCWARTSEELEQTHRDDLLRVLKARLYEAGLADLDGWCALGLHGEYRDGSGYFELHFHGVIVGAKVQAFLALEDVPMFAGGEDKPIRVPVRIDELENPPRQLAYILQGFWPWKYRDETPGADNSRRRRRRIPEPHHAEHLMWLSRQTFSDLVWLHGVAIREGRLRPTSRN